MKHSGSMDILGSSPAQTRVVALMSCKAIVMFGLPAALGWCVLQATNAHAQSGPTTESRLLQDCDGDGLEDALESGLHSAQDQVDTDGDGWNDAEELARGSLATTYCSQPVGDPEADLGASAYMRDGKLHAVFAVWVRSGSLAALQMDIGIGVGQRMVSLAPSAYASRMVVTSVPTKESGQLLLVTDVVLSHSPLVRTGSMAVFATLRLGNEILAADSVNLVLRGGVPMELIAPSKLSPLADAQLGPGLLYRPLGGTQVPLQWTAGEICFQQLSPVGTHGAVVTQEVTSSECITGWDGYCDASSCQSSVGTTVDLVDPAALVGG